MVLFVSSLVIQIFTLKYRFFLSFYTDFVLDQSGRSVLSIMFLK